MRIYENYVKKYSDEILEKKKKDPETIEELDRQLKYMEKSIGALRQMTSKAEQRTKTNVKKRTNENRELISELNKLRHDKRQLEAFLESETLKLQKLALEKTRISRELHNFKMSQTNGMNYGSNRVSLEGLSSPNKQ